MSRDMMASRCAGCNVRPDADGFCRGLEMPADFLAQFFPTRGTANLRFLHYPPRDRGEDNLVGQAPHTDNSLHDGDGRARCGRVWRSAAEGRMVCPAGHSGTFLINVAYDATVVRRRFRSKPHGVLTIPDRRYSIANSQPNPDRRHRMPAMSCVSPGGPTTRRVLASGYRDLVLDSIERIFFFFSPTPPKRKGPRSEAAGWTGAAAE